jgi:hypothetical protein
LRGGFDERYDEQSVEIPKAEIEIVKTRLKRAKEMSEL